MFAYHFIFFNGTANPNINQCEDQKKLPLCPEQFITLHFVRAMHWFDGHLTYLKHYLQGLTNFLKSKISNLV